jgi:antitoxin MazE
MNANIIKIGNSRGLIIPKKMLQELGAESEVNIEYQNGGLFISPIDETRKGWAVAFKKSSSKQVKSEDILDEVENDFDQEEWTW